MKSDSALATQVGGEHYKSKGIQPVEFIHSNNLTFIEGNVIKYVWRWRDKGGIADLEKAKHYIEMLIELETPKAKPQANGCDCGALPGHLHYFDCGITRVVE